MTLFFPFLFTSVSVFGTTFLQKFSSFSPLTLYPSNISEFRKTHLRSDHEEFSHGFSISFIFVTHLGGPNPYIYIVVNVRMVT